MAEATLEEHVENLLALGRLMLGADLASGRPDPEDLGKAIALAVNGLPVVRQALAKQDGVSVGPIGHEPFLCGGRMERGRACDCWCAICEAHQATREPHADNEPPDRTPRCAAVSSLTQRRCVLLVGHPADTPERFHKFTDG